MYKINVAFEKTPLNLLNAVLNLNIFDLLYNTFLVMDMLYYIKHFYLYKSINSCSLDVSKLSLLIDFSSKNSS